jgi:glycosyltransferase involved in cell wall biosynthesis
MTANPPTISIAMPIYNGIDYLTAAVQSALQQMNASPLEIVLFDDASTDTSPAMIDSFAAQPLVRAVKLTERLPTAAAWNAAVRATSGDYVLVLAQDDLIDPEFIAASTKVIVEHPEVDLVIFGHRKIDGQGNFTSNEPLANAGLGTDLIVDPTKFTDRFARKGQFFFPSAVVFRRSAFEVVGGFDEKLRYAYDWDLYLRMGTWAKLWLDHRILCSYRIHVAQSMTAFLQQDNADADHIFTKLTDMGPPGGKLNAGQMKWLVEGMCDFLRQRLSRALRDSNIPIPQVLEVRQRVIEKLIEWKQSGLPHAKYIRITPETAKRAIAWKMSGSALGVRSIRAMLGVK